MKLYNKSSFILVSMAFLMSVLFSCQEELVTYDSSAPVYQKQADPYLQVITGFLQFEPGTAAYDFQFNLINGTNALNEIKMYKTFYDAGVKKSSDEVMVGSYTTSDPLRNVVELSLTYDDLASGITVDGNSLPASDEDIVPGSGWSFRFEGVRSSSGETVDLDGAINMVLSKYAGLYEVVESKYVRSTSIVEDFGGWNGSQVFIGFVSETELSYNDAWGYFAWGGCHFDIKYNPETLVVTDVPVLTECGLFSGDSRLTCAGDAVRFTDLNAALGFDACDVSNIIVDDDVNGEHEIILTYGYLASSGPRQFYEKLRKIVN